MRRGTEVTRVYLLRQGRRSERPCRYAEEGPGVTIHLLIEAVVSPKMDQLHGL